MDKILVYDDLGNEVEKEVVLMLKVDNKIYFLYKDIVGNKKKMYASSCLDDELNNKVINLNNDLTEEEYSLLELAYKKGKKNYDREK